MQQRPGLVILCIHSWSFVDISSCCFVDLLSSPGVSPWGRGAFLDTPRALEVTSRKDRNSGEGAEENFGITGREGPNRPARRGRVEPMDEQLKQMMKELGEAINETLSSSESISGAIATIRNSGYDVFLVLEATIGFNKRSEESPEEPALTESEDIEARLNITSQDVKFLKSLKISLEDSESQ